MSSKRVYWIEGDGIGPEIWRAARPVIDAALAKESDMRIEWVELLAGEKATAETGSPLPEETMNALRTADFAMKGPLGTPVGTGIRSLNVALRQTLNLYACIRPVRHFEGLETPVKHPERVNMVIFRENTEDVYAGIEYAAQTPEAKKLIAFLREEFGVTKIREEAAVGIKPMSEFGSKRLVRRALRFALDTGSKSLTLVHKGNIMKFTEGGFRQWGYDVAAQEFGDLTCTEKEPVEPPGGQGPHRRRHVPGSPAASRTVPDPGHPQPQRRLHLRCPGRAGGRSGPGPGRQHVRLPGLL